MKTMEYAEFRRQVDELLKNGFIKISLSPCVVPALKPQTKDRSWRIG